MEFALIISGPDAPTPAPRVPAVPAYVAGIWDSESETSWTPDRDAIAAALPAKLRRFYKRAPANVWFDKHARLESGRCVPSLPYMTLSKANGDHVATVYFAPVIGTPGDEFAAFKARRAQLETETAAASAALQVFPSGPTGLTPDAVKFSPEFQAASARYAKAAGQLRELNGANVKRFAKELAAERDARRLAITRGAQS